MMTRIISMCAPAAVLVALCVGMPGAARAQAQVKISFVGADSTIAVGDPAGTGVSVPYLKISTQLAPGAGSRCTTHLIPSPGFPDIDCLLDPQLFGHECGDGSYFDPPPSYVEVRHCVSNGPRSPVFHTDSSNIVSYAVSTLAFHLEDVSSIPAAGQGTVLFGIPNPPRYALIEENSGSCPSGTALITAKTFSALSSSSRVCVETAQSSNAASVASTVAGYFNDLSTASDVADQDILSTRDAAATMTGNLLLRYVCYVDNDFKIIVCVTDQGKVDLGTVETAAISSVCPTPIDPAKVQQCINRGNQTPFGCAVIGCVEALNALGYQGCVNAMRNELDFLGVVYNEVGARSVCTLIHNRDHYYTAGFLGTPARLCSTSSQRCTVNVAFNTVLGDVRAQAPGVLQGPPAGGVAAPPITSAVPIDTTNPNRLYYLGPDILYSVFGSTLTTQLPRIISNPIRIAVNSTPQSVSYGPIASLRFHTVTCPTATNIADPDHVLVGIAQQCLFTSSDGNLYSIVVGTGTNTRFALLNELTGPRLLGTVQTNLFNLLSTIVAPTGPCTKRICDPTD